jgi:hypothetical protein
LRWSHLAAVSGLPMAVIASKRCDV